MKEVETKVGMSDSSLSSSPEEVVKLKSRLKDKKASESQASWDKVVRTFEEDLATNMVGPRTSTSGSGTGPRKSSVSAWGESDMDTESTNSRRKSSIDMDMDMHPSGRGRPSSAQVQLDSKPESSGISLSSLKQLRQELEEAKLERRNLLKAAQKAIKNPLKIEIPHRPEVGSAPKKDVKNQRRKVLKEVVDALSLSLESGDGKGKGKGASSMDENNRAIFDYDIEIQAVVSFVQDRFQELLSEAVDDLKAKARTHKHKALAKAEENASQRVRNLERASRQEQESLNQEVFKCKRQIDNLKKKVSSAQRETSLKERESKSVIEEITKRERIMEEKLSKALERAQRAEKRATEASNFMTTQVEEIQKQSALSISQYREKIETCNKQLEEQRSRSDRLAKDYEELLNSTQSGQDQMRDEVRQIEEILAPCEALLEERDSFLNTLKQEAQETNENTLQTFKGFVKDISDACITSETVLKSWTQYFKHVNQSGNWISKDKHDTELQILRDEKTEQEKKLDNLQSELNGFQKVVARAQTDKAISDTKVRKLAETATELRQKIEEETEKSLSLEQELGVLQAKLEVSQADLAERGRKIELECNRVEELTKECQKVEERGNTMTREAWSKASTSLSEVDNRLSLLVTREPLKLGKESWLEVLTAMDQRTSTEENGSENDEEEKENFFASLNGLESTFVSALKTVAVSVQQEEKEKAKKLVRKPSSPMKKAKPKTVAQRSVASKPTRVIERSKLGLKSIRSPSKAKSKANTDVQTVLSVIKKARDLSCFDIKMSLVGDNQSRSRKESSGIKSLAKSRIFSS